MGPKLPLVASTAAGGKTGRERRGSGAGLALALDSTGRPRAPAGSCARLRCGSLVGPGGDAALPALPCVRWIAVMPTLRPRRSALAASLVHRRRDTVKHSLV